jgi:hypothetical protein
MIEVVVSKEKITKYYWVVIRIDVRISRIPTDFGDKKSVGIREICEIRTSIRITTESYWSKN